VIENDASLSGSAAARGRPSIGGALVRRLVAAQFAFDRNLPPSEALGRIRDALGD
jgi:hypothetical protein